MEKADKLIALLREYADLGIVDQIDYQKFYLYSLITHSTAIEGSTVTEIENQLLFDEGITAWGRNIQEQMMNLDLKVAYEHSLKLAEQHTDYSTDMLINLSAIVMKNTGSQYNTAQGTFDASKGELRLVGVTAGIGGNSYMNYRKVPAKLEEFCSQLNESRHKLLDTDDLIAKYILSFNAHYQLVTIHPWVDGNGRMARLIMNQLQYEFGLIPSMIVKDHKAEYIQALVDSRVKESLEPFRDFMLDEQIRNIGQEIEGYRKSQSFDPIKSISEPAAPYLDPITDKLFQAIKQDNTLNYDGYATLLGVSPATIKRRLSKLRATGAIVRIGSKKTGKWQIK